MLFLLLDDRRYFTCVGFSRLYHQFVSLVDFSNNDPPLILSTAILSSLRLLISMAGTTWIWYVNEVHTENIYSRRSSLASIVRIFAAQASLVMIQMSTSQGQWRFDFRRSQVPLHSVGPYALSSPRMSWIFPTLSPTHDRLPFLF